MADDYEFEIDIQVRFRDIDAMNHVNNAVYASYLEQARTEYYREIIGEPLTEVDTVLASMSIDFRAPIEIGDEVTIGLTIDDIGTSSLTMAYEVRRDDGTVAATAETVQVVFDPETGSSKPIPEAWLEAIDAAA